MEEVISFNKRGETGEKNIVFTKIVAKTHQFRPVILIYFRLQYPTTDKLTGRKVSFFIIRFACSGVTCER